MPRNLAFVALVATALATCAISARAVDTLNLAPESPERPWPLPETGAESSTPIPASTMIDAGRTYDLPALIDLAQRSNPATREAWERARQAALAVGLVESAYLPELSIEALGGFQRTPLPIPATLIPRGYFTSDTREIVPTLALKWLLFDFGRRDSADAAARANSFVANVTFTGAHQKVIFAVSRDYYAFGSARDKREAAEKALRTAEIDRAAVEAHRANGLATTVDSAHAQRQVAQARFNFARASGSERTSRAALLADVGVPLTIELEIARDAGGDMPTALLKTVDDYVTQALRNRPDILADVAHERAAQATLEKARAEHRPTVSLAAQAYQNIGALSSDGGPYTHVNKPGGALFLQFSMPLFDGGKRDTEIAIARSEVDASADQTEAARHKATREVVDAYNGLATALAEHEAANAVAAAARTAHDAGLEAYRRGVGTYTTLMDDENAIAQAETDLADARASVRTAAAALAFSTGSIGARCEQPGGCSQPAR
jgi:outer membrane protein TolC